MIEGSFLAPSSNSSLERTPSEFYVDKKATESTHRGEGRGGNGHAAAPGRGQRTKQDKPQPRPAHLVHGVEDFVDALLGRVLVLWQGDHVADHLVDGADNLHHLVPRDGAVAVKVVQGEGPWTSGSGVPMSRTQEREERDKSHFTPAIGTWRKRTVELLARVASRRDGEGADELLKVDGAILF